ncbi:sugar ABC transporter permease [Bifidobacterium pullorum subsp. saeculare]|uniref:Sugar ABC transporter permease n=1 Tax=Bifidobacterium pullorum subsp. saeculare TaxID=78257 RepID=A0A939BA57_9BIFI|nr:sugar ABC transporter permease [Bifidobacterium pullorum]MBM6699980.1 sugar ABC transporter permease [Bifidobacterium pullorum subsp. saeculare]
MSRTTKMDRRRRGSSMSDKRRKGIEITILSAPALIMFLGFVILPVFMAAYYGFYRWKGYGSPSINGEFIGFDNYKMILTDPNFQQAVGHTMFVVVMSLVIQGPLAILFALLLNQKFKGRAIIRTLIFVPYVVSEVIVGTGWSLMLQSAGAVNALLEKIGLSGADWISDPHIAIWTLMFIITWKYIGFAVILMIAGMQAIPEELYEAAKVDGASFWQMQWRITLPLLAPTIRIWAFLSIIGSLQLFDLVYIVWGQYVSSTAGTSTMATYMVREGRLANNYGYGSAVAVVIFIISLVISLAYQRFILNRDLEGAITDEKDAKRREKRAQKEAAKLARKGHAVVAKEVA